MRKHASAPCAKRWRWAIVSSIQRRAIATRAPSVAPCDRAASNAKDVFIATKLTIANTTYEKAKESCKRSLDRLGVSAIDLLLLQYPYNDVFGAWRALTELREEGLVHAIGVCNFAADRLADLVLHVKERPQVAQFERHPYYQRPQLMEYLRRQDIQPLARGPFAGCKTDLLKNPTVCAIASAHSKTPCQVLLRWQTLRDVAVIPTTAGSRRAR